MEGEQEELEAVRAVPAQEHVVEIEVLVREVRGVEAPDEAPEPLGERAAERERGARPGPQPRAQALGAGELLADDEGAPRGGARPLDAPGREPRSRDAERRAALEGARLGTRVDDRALPLKPVLGDLAPADAGVRFDEEALSAALERGGLARAVLAPLHRHLSEREKVLEGEPREERAEVGPHPDHRADG